MFDEVDAAMSVQKPQHDVPGRVRVGGHRHRRRLQKLTTVGVQVQRVNEKKARQQRWCRGWQSALCQNEGQAECTLESNLGGRDPGSL